MASRDTLSCSLPVESSCDSSVMAGTWRRRRRASKRRCSSVLADQGSCTVQPSWPSISLTNWPIFAAAASACSRWMRISAVLCSWYENQISNSPLANSARQTTATNRPTYLRNSRPRTLASRENRGSTRRATPSATTRSSDGMESPTYAISALSRAYAYHQARGDRSVASKRSTASFDHLVGATEEWQWNGEAECLRGSEVDDKLDFGDVLNRQLCRLLAFQDPSGIDACQTIAPDRGAVAYQPARCDKRTVLKNRR